MADPRRIALVALSAFVAVGVGTALVGRRRARSSKSKLKLGILVIAGSARDPGYYREVKGQGLGSLCKALEARGFRVLLLAPQSYMAFARAALQGFSASGREILTFRNKAELLSMLRFAAQKSGPQDDCYLHVLGHGGYRHKGTSAANQYATAQGFEEASVHYVQFERLKALKTAYFSGPQLVKELERRISQGIPIPFPADDVEGSERSWVDAVKDDPLVDPRPPDVKASGDFYEAPRAEMDWHIKVMADGGGVYVSPQEVAVALECLCAARFFFMLDCCFSAGFARQVWNDQDLCPSVPVCHMATSAKPRDPAAGEITFAVAHALSAKNGSMRARDLFKFIFESHLFSEERVTRDKKDAPAEVPGLSSGSSTVDGDLLEEIPPPSALLLRQSTDFIPHFSVWKVRPTDPNSAGLEADQASPFRMFEVSAAGE